MSVGAKRERERERERAQPTLQKIYQARNIACMVVCYAAWRQLFHRLIESAILFSPFATLFCPVSILQNGFFASAGPLDIFVSQYGLPSDLKFDTSGTSGTPVLHSEDADVRIEIGTEVRVKLIGIRMAADQIAVLGTIKEDFLG